MPYDLVHEDGGGEDSDHEGIKQLAFAALQAFTKACVDEGKCVPCTAQHLIRYLIAGVFEADNIGRDNYDEACDFTGQLVEDALEILHGPET